MIPQNKQQLIQEIETTFTKLLSDIQKVPNELANEKVLEWQVKNTTVSVHNLLSYLLWWWKLVLKWELHFENISEIELPEAGYKWNELGKLAQKFYTDYEDVDFEELKSMLIENNTEIVRMIEKYENQDLYEKPWYGKWTFGRMIQFNTSSPYKNIRTRIRKYIKQEELL